MIGSNAGGFYQNLGLTNSGTINANTATNALTIGGTGSAVVNTGLFEATAGGTLLLASNAPVTNTGGTILTNGHGSTVTVNTAILGGTLSTANHPALFPAAQPGPGPIPRAGNRSRCARPERAGPGAGPEPRPPARPNGRP